MAKSAGLEGTVTAKVCVDATGNVTGVTLLRHMAMGMDEEVTKKCKAQKYEPFMFNGRAVPFCRVINFVFKLR
jgi:TonB family protein